MLIVQEIIYADGVKVYDTVSLGMQWLSWADFAKKIIAGYDCDALTYNNSDKTIRDHFGNFVAKAFQKGVRAKLDAAKKAKDDEFYTIYEDIEEEISYYPKDTFKDKVVYCCCDSDQSNFVKYFKNNKDTLGYKELIHTCYADGFDFRGEECKPYFEKADIVVTNPPFSLFADFIETLYKYDVDFLVLGSNLGITQSRVFSYLLEERLNIGYTDPGLFIRPDGSKSEVRTFWYTTLKGTVEKYFPDTLITYEEGKYKKYLNTNGVDIIEVPLERLIPTGYKGLMAVPSSWIIKYNPKQFKIYGTDLRFLYKDDIIKHNYNLKYIDDNGKEKIPFARFIIQYREDFVCE